MLCRHAGAMVEYWRTEDSTNYHCGLRICTKWTLNLLCLDSADHHGRSSHLPVLSIPQCVSFFLWLVMYLDDMLITPCIWGTSMYVVPPGVSFTGPENVSWLVNFWCNWPLGATESLVTTILHICSLNLGQTLDGQWPVCHLHICKWTFPTYYVIWTNHNVSFIDVTPS